MQLTDFEMIADLKSVIFRSGRIIIRPDLDISIIIRPDDIIDIIFFQK